jgi:hypothetical protein
MARMNGERQQDYQARMAFAVEAAVATAAKQKEHELKRMHGIPLEVVEIRIPCTCALVNWPHFHSKMEQRRFDERMAPGGDDEARMLRRWEDE